MRAPLAVGVLAGAVAILLAIATPALLHWASSLPWWVRIPLVSLDLLLMTAGGLIAGMALQEHRITLMSRSVDPSARG